MRTFAVFAISSFLAISGALANENTGVTRSSIKIGVFGPLSGASSIFAKTVYGAAAVYKDVNDRGGINGRKLDIVLADDGCKGPQGVAAVRKLIDEDKVFLLHGAVCTEVSLAIKPEIAKPPFVPYMVMSAASDAVVVPVQPNIFHGAQTASIIAKQMAEFALTKPHAKRIAIIVQTDSWGDAHLKPALNALKKHGVEPVIVVPFARGSQSASKEVAEIKEKAPDAVLAILYPAELAVYVRDAYKAGFQVTTVGHASPTLEDTDKKVGIPRAMDDVFLFYRLSDLTTGPALIKYGRLLKKYYPAEVLDPHAFYGMGGALAIVEALRRCGHDVTRKRFIAELNKLRDFDSKILSGHISYSKTNHIGVKTGKMSTLINHRLVIVSTYGDVQKYLKRETPTVSR